MGVVRRGESKILHIPLWELNQNTLANSALKDQLKTF